MNEVMQTGMKRLLREVISFGSFLKQVLFRRAYPARYIYRAQRLPIQVAQELVEVLESFASSARCSGLAQ
jgi:hypothetical protein